MANIWTDKRFLNNENSQFAPLKSKQTLTNGSRSARKQVFGEIKNVMHNQVGVTPLKGNAAKIDGLPSAFSSSKSLCNEVLRKQQMKQNLADVQNKLVNKNKLTMITETYKEPEFDESLFDSWDIDRACCKQQKSDEEIWSEMNMLDISFSNFEIDDIKEDCIAPIFIPEFDELPNLRDFDLEYEPALDVYPQSNLPDLCQFIDIDELSF